MRPSNSASPHDQNIDPAIAGASAVAAPGSGMPMAVGGSNESGGEDAQGEDGTGKKGNNKRELSTSKRAAQNRAAQVSFISR